jgi:hypothetical protein
MEKATSITMQGLERAAKKPPSQDQWSAIEKTTRNAMETTKKADEMPPSRAFVAASRRSVSRFGWAQMQTPGPPLPASGRCSGHLNSAARNQRRAIGAEIRD